MKAVISQTIFTAMATTHGENRERLVADYDANGWPQTARNEALREIRKAFAVHLAGDQHLPAMVHYGIEMHRDAAVAFAGPAVNTGYPRWFEPARPGKNRAPNAPKNTGDFLDTSAIRMTVLAVANGAVKPRGPVLERLLDKSSGLGLVRFDKPRRKITFECWPFLQDPTIPGTQFPGWPVTVDQSENFSGPAAVFLPEILVQGAPAPVVQVVNEKDGEIVYTVRMPGPRFRPRVFAPGVYTVKVSDPEKGLAIEKTGLQALLENQPTVELRL